MRKSPAWRICALFSLTIIGVHADLPAVGATATPSRPPQASGQDLTSALIKRTSAPLMLKQGRYVPLTQQQMNELTAASRPQLGNTCELDLNDDGAISLLPNMANDSFAYFPYWNQNCGGARYLRAWPSDDEHFHLYFEDETIAVCAAPECDPLTEPRAGMQPHVSSAHMRFDEFNSATIPSSRVYFAADRVKISGGAASLCFRQRATGPWIAWTSDAEPGAWLCFARLELGTWDLSEWMGGGAKYVEVSAPLSGPITFWQVAGLRLRTVAN